MSNHVRPQLSKEHIKDQINYPILFNHLTISQHLQKKKKENNLTILCFLWVIPNAGKILALFLTCFSSPQTWQLWRIKCRIQVASHLKGVSLVWNLISFQWISPVWSFDIDSTKEQRGKKKSLSHNYWFILWDYLGQELLLQLWSLKEL